MSIFSYRKEICARIVSLVFVVSTRKFHFDSGPKFQPKTLNHAISLIINNGKVKYHRKIFVIQSHWRLATHTQKSTH